MNDGILLSLYNFECIMIDNYVLCIIEKNLSDIIFQYKTYYFI